MKPIRPTLTAPNLVIGISIASLVGLFLFLLLVPMPSTRGMDIERRKKEGQIKVETDTVRDRLQVAKAEVVAQTWTGGEQQIAPQALARVSRLVRARNLQLIAFRPQRRQDDGPLPMIPFLLTVDGSYPNVVSLVRELEQPGTRLAVSLVQIASADAASDRVSASIGLVAYVNEPQEATRG